MHISQWIFRNEQQRGKQIALEGARGAQTWSETADRVRRIGGALTGFGVERNENVAVMSLNCALYYELVYGIPAMGARTVPLNIRWAAPELAYAINDSDSRTLLFDQTFTEMANNLRQQKISIERYLFMGDRAVCPEWAQPLEDAIAAAQPHQALTMSDDGVLGIYYTGGTTGFSKGVILTHIAAYTSSISLMSEMNLDKEMNFCHVAPMFHVADLAATWGYTICPAKHLFMPAFDPVKYVDFVAEKKITDGLLVPAMIQMTFDHPSFDASKLATLKRLFYGASPMSEGLLRRVMKAVPHLSMGQAYGQTELAPMATFLPFADHVLEGERSRLLRSAGRAVSCVNLRIADDAGNILATGEIGEVCVAGPNAMLGYLNKPEETAKALRDGWVHTGDAGYLDDEGYLFLVDRVKDMIVSGGENVYSTEVESAISTHGAVAQVAVIGIPHEKWGEQVHAVVVLQSGAQADEQSIIKHCKSLIADYKCPRSVQFRDDPLPLTGAGKVLKRELRAPFWEGKDRQVG